jgi:hypothetical protein
MRRALWLVLVVILGLALAACAGDGGDDNNDDNAESDGQLGLFDWERSSDVIVVRLDSQASTENPAYMLNRIPSCTLWGDGHLVWVTRTDSGARAVLEARIDDATIRAFVENIISRGFYDWTDELVPPSVSNPVVESITVSLYDETHTVRRHSSWPRDGYRAILRECQNLAEQPVQVEPEAGWVSAYPVERDPQSPGWLWPDDAPFSLKELADSGEARWLTGDLATYIWNSAREPRDDIQVIENISEEEQLAFQVAIVVPGVSRHASPPPDGFEEPEPEPDGTVIPPDATELSSVDGTETPSDGS